MANVSDTLKSALLDLIESTNDSVLIMAFQDIEEQEPRIVYVNPAFCRISGYTKDEIIGKTKRILQGPRSCKNTLARIEAAMEAGEECQEEILNYSKGGTPYWIDTHIVPLHTNSCSTKYFGAIQRDITDKKNAIEDLEQLAHMDVLTGIANRAALDQYMANLSETTDTKTDKPCMLMFDLDGFKEVNDTLGHIAGDKILRHFAEYVISTLRPNDFLARLGGDEFVAILRGYSPEAARLLAEQTVSDLASMGCCGAEKIGVSVGVTFFRWGDGLEEVIAHADSALYRAKDAGKGTVRIHPQTPAPPETAGDQQKLASS